MTDPVMTDPVMANPVMTHPVMTHPVMPAKAGIQDLLCRDEDESWIPAFAGMTGGNGSASIYRDVSIAGRVVDARPRRL